MGWQSFEPVEHGGEGINMDLAMVRGRLSGLATVHLEPMRSTSVFSLWVFICVSLVSSV